jgi:hypothetical protein
VEYFPRVMEVTHMVELCYAQIVHPYHYLGLY